VISASPKYCFTLAGINDIPGDTAYRIFLNYQTIIDTCWQMRFSRVQSTPVRRNPSGNRKVSYLNYLLKDYCIGKSIAFIDLNQFMTDANGLITEYSTDGTHLSERGYELWSEKLKQVIAGLRW
jgi:lysophospholipase L1-like esterase